METKAMNETIDKLAYFHGMYCDGTPDSWDSEAINNFALAIVEECIKAAEATRPNHVRTTFDDAMAQGTIQCVVESIKHKFGL
jgi:hypothetical protein